MSVASSGKGIRHFNSDCRRLSWSSLWSVPSSSFQVTPKWKNHLITAIQKGVGVWATRPPGTSWNSARINTKSCTCEGRDSYNVTVWSFEQRCWEELGEMLVDEKLGISLQCALAMQTKNIQVSTRRFRKVVILLCTVSVRSLLEAFNKF